MFALLLGFFSAEIDFDGMVSKIKGELMKSITVVVSKVGISGPPGTGKTRLRALLMGEDCPDKRKSTGISTTADEIIENFASFIFSKEKKKNKLSWKLADRDQWALTLAKNIYKTKGFLSDDISVITKCYNRGKCRRLGLLGMIITKLKNMKRQDCTKTPVNTVRLIYLVDNGGQPQFQQLLPKFLHSSIYLLVHKLSQTFEHKPKFSYVRNDKSYYVDQTRNDSNFTIISQSVRSICSISRAVETTTVPAIAYIGTFKDHVEDDELEDILTEKSKEIIQKLDKFTSNPVQCEFITKKRKEREMIVFPIDGSRNGWKLNNEVINDLKHKIFEKGVHQSMPIWYIVFLQDIKNMKKKIVSVQDCRDTMEKFSFKLCNDDIEAALNMFHTLNIILYFPRILKNLVILDPNFLYERVTRIVVRSFQIEHDQMQLRRRDFSQTGILTVKFLENIFSNHELISKEDFFLLLEELLIAARISKDEFFMPCVLPSERNPFKIPLVKDIAHMMKEKDIEGPLVITFGDHVCPCGLFCSLIVELIKIPGWTLNKKNFVRRGNLIDFSYCHDSTIIGKVLVWDKSTCMKVYTNCDAEYCNSITVDIDNSLKRACKSMQYLPTKLKIELGFDCRKCKDKDIHYSMCTFHHNQWKENCSYLSRHDDLSERKKPWFSGLGRGNRNGKISFVCRYCK